MSRRARDEMGSWICFSICSAYMGIMFAFWAAVQLNDQAEWYLWLPLYNLAAAVNMMAVVNMSRARCRRYVVGTTFWFGLALFVKVVIEACLLRETNALKWREFLSLDLKRRVVREKLGSAQVIISMCLHSMAFLTSQKVRNRVELGMILLAAVNGSVCLFFFLAVKKI